MSIDDLFLLLGDRVRFYIGDLTLWLPLMNKSPVLHWWLNLMATVDEHVLPSVLPCFQLFSFGGERTVFVLASNNLIPAASVYTQM